MLDLQRVITRHTRVHYFGHAPQTPRKHRRPAGHGLDHYQSERLRPLDREYQCRRVAQQVVLLLVIHRADVPDALPIDEGLDFLFKICLLLRLLRLPRQHDRHSRRARDSDRIQRVLVMRHPSQERQVSPSLKARLERPKVASVVHHGDLPAFGELFRLATAYPCQRNRGKIPRQPPVVV